MKGAGETTLHTIISLIECPSTSIVCLHRAPRDYVLPKPHTFLLGVCFALFTLNVSTVLLYRTHSSQATTVLRSSAAATRQRSSTSAGLVLLTPLLEGNVGGLQAPDLSIQSIHTACFVQFHPKCRGPLRGAGGERWGRGDSIY